MADTKKYGLIIKKKTKEKPLKKASVFGNDSSDEEDKPKSSINVSLMREAQKKKQMKQTQIEMEKALKEDPNVYEYDNVYDDMAQKKSDAIPKLAEKHKKPKYIKRLLESAKTRKMEDERRMERKIQKEREQEGGEFQDKEEFVTSAYRNRMVELQEEEERLKKQEAVDAANDVTKKSDLNMFYSNLLKHNVSMGGSFTADAQTENIDSEKIVGDNVRKDNKEKNDKDAKEEKPSQSVSKHSRDSRKDPERCRTDQKERHSSTSKYGESDQRRKDIERRRTSSEERSYHRRDKHSERNDKQRKSRRDSEDSSHHHSERRRETDSPEKTSRSENETYRSSEGSSHKEKQLSPKAEIKTDKTDVKTDQESTAPSKFAKRSNNETVSSARERFLERKRAREMQEKQDESDED